MALAWFLAIVVLMAYDPFDVGVLMILVVPAILAVVVLAVLMVEMVVCFLRPACRGIMWRPLSLGLKVLYVLLPITMIGRTCSGRERMCRPITALSTGMQWFQILCRPG